MDLVDISNEIKYNKNDYKYILNIIDCISKLLGSYLIEKKMKQNILYAINELISFYG